MSSVAQLRRIFETITGHYQSVGLTDMLHHIVNAEYLDEQTISSTHESRLLQGTNLLQAPYPVHSIIKKTEAGWKVAKSSYAARDDTLAGRALNSAMQNKPKDL